MDQALVTQAHEEDWPFVRAVKAGCSVAPPAGLPDMKDLIETLAERLAEICLQDPRVRRAEVTLHKPGAPIAATFADVTLTIIRSSPRTPLAPETNHD